MKRKEFLLILTTVLLLFSSCFSTKKITVNDKVKVILLGGQSNMAGAGNYTALSDEDKARVKKASEDVLLSINGNPAKPLAFQTKKKGKYDFTEAFGPELFIGVTLSEKYPGQQFLLIKRSQGGTALYGAWNPNWSAEKAKAVEKEGPKRTMKLYESHHKDIQMNLDALKAKGIAFELVGMAWFQGENDAAKEVAARTYEENLKILIAGYRNKLDAPKMPFVIGQINSTYGRFKEGPEMVRNAMVKVAEGDKEVDIIKTTTDRSWPDYPKHSDNVHYNEVGQKRLGIAFADRLEGLIHN